MMQKCWIRVYFDDPVGFRFSGNRFGRLKNDCWNYMFPCRTGDVKISGRPEFFSSWPEMLQKCWIRVYFHDPVRSTFPNAVPNFAKNFMSPTRAIWLLISCLIVLLTYAFSVSVVRFSVVLRALFCLVLVSFFNFVLFSLGFPVFLRIPCSWKRVCNQWHVWYVPSAKPVAYMQRWLHACRNMSKMHTVRDIKFLRNFAKRRIIILSGGAAN